MAETPIEWATHVLNAFTGCDRITPGCAHCYALTTAKRRKGMELGRARVATEQGKPLPVMRYQNDGDPRTSGPGFGFTVHWDKLENPERFPAGARVFVNSMSDVFHEEAAYGAIIALFEVFRQQPEASFLVLTKRPERMKMVMHHVVADQGGALPNVWLGVTIENRRFVHRADLLRETPAAVRFVSAEPLLGPLIHDDATTYGPWSDPTILTHWRDKGHESAVPELDLTSIDWLIAGGESGPKARPCREEWLRDLRDACAETGTAYFLKQLGARLARERGLKGKGGGGQATLDGEVHHAMPSAQGSLL